MLIKATDFNILTKSLTSLEVECLFGSESYMLTQSAYSAIKYYQLKHEQAAVHAADGFARASGKPGVVLLTTVSGITNGITGIATAYSDSVPLVVIASGLFSNYLGNESLHELNISGMMMPITKYAFKMNTLDNLQNILAEALQLANSGRPGPVLVEIASDYANNKEEKKNVPNHATKIKMKHIENSIEMVLNAIETASKPVLFIGGGVIAAEASDVLKEFVDRSGIPVAASLMGIAAMDQRNPQFLGMLGMHGTFAANKAVHRCNLLICIGVRFSDRVTGKISGFSPKSKKIHVDIDPAEINKIIPVEIPIVQDAREFLVQLKERLDYGKVKEKSNQWVNEVTGWKRTVPHFNKSNSLLSPQTVIQTLAKYANDDTIMVTDVGQHQIWTAHYFPFKKPRSFLTSGGLGTMGYGLPAAIGAATLSPSKSVICVSGDGSFQMNLQELITAVKYKLPIKIAILNNGYLGMVRQWQELFYHKRYSSVKISSPNFAELAKAYGLAGYRAKNEEEAQEIIRLAFRHDGPVLMEFDVIEEENVYPMVPPNQSNHHTILSR